MEDKKTKKISLTGVLLILAIIAIIVMGVFIFILNKDKLEEQNKAAKLQNEVTNLNSDIDSLNKKIDTISQNTTNTNTITNTTTNTTSNTTTNTTSNTTTNSNTAITNETTNTTTTSNENVQTQPTVSDIDSKDIINEAYHGIQENTSGEFNSTTIDINHDGIDELLLAKGAIEADKTLTIYTYKDGKVKEIGTIGFGHSALYKMNNENYLLLVHAHMGAETVSKLYIKDDTIQTEEISSREVPAGESYTEGDVALDLYV